MLIQALNFQTIARLEVRGARRKYGCEIVNREFHSPQKKNEEALSFFFMFFLTFTHNKLTNHNASYTHKISVFLFSQKRTSPYHLIFIDILQRYKNINITILLHTYVSNFSFHSFYVQIIIANRILLNILL